VHRLAADDVGKNINSASQEGGFTPPQPRTIEPDRATTARQRRMSDALADGASNRAEATGTSRPRRKTWTSGQFAARPIAMLESAAMRVLTLAERKALDRIEIEHAHHGG